MKLSGLFSSTRCPEAGTPVRTSDEVLSALMGLNRPTALYRLVDGHAEGVDVIAERKIVDAQSKTIWRSDLWRLPDPNGCSLSRGARYDAELP